MLPQCVALKITKGDKSLHTKKDPTTKKQPGLICSDSHTGRQIYLIKCFDIQLYFCIW